MNLKSLIDTFWSDVDDLEEPHNWPRADVVRWINEAEDEACIRARLIFDKTFGGTELLFSAGETVATIHPAIVEISNARLVDGAGIYYPINPTDRIELDRIYPKWRTTTGRPKGFIHDDLTIEIDRIADADYTMLLETYRKPLAPIVNNEDEPEIGAIHHRMLVEWVKHRAYGKPDADLFNAGESAAALDKFESYFGKRPAANLRRRQQANRPHANKAYW